MAKIRWWLGRLHVQFTVYVALLLVAFTTLVLAFNWRGQQEIVLDRLAAHVDYVADLTAIFAADRLAENDPDGLAEIIAEIIDQEDAFSIIVSGLDGEQLYVQQGDAALPPATALGPSHEGISADRIHADAPIIVGSEAIGTVHIERALQTPGAPAGSSVLGSAAFGDELRSVRSLLIRNLLIGIGVFLLAIPAVAFMMRRATSGISSVTNAAKRAADGDLTAQLPTSGFGEISELQEAFRRMQLELRESITRIEKLAYVDTVTDLANRPLFNLRLDQALDDPAIARGAVIVVDIDHFQGVNDTFGHTIGDEILRGTGIRLEAVLTAAKAESLFSGEWTLARLSGDEFAALIVGGARPEQVEHLADMIVKAMDEPFEVAGARLNLGCSIGVSLFRHGDTSVQVLKEADLALFSAKQSGRRDVRFYSAEIGTTAQRRAEIESELRHAIRAGEITVHYQPIISCETLAIVGAEALARWKHPTKGFVAPSEFIPIAEESGLIVDIGNHVLRKSLCDMRQLRERGIKMSVAVNAAAAQLHRADYAETVMAALQESGVPGEQLEIELTETAAVLLSDRPEQTTRQLQALGVRFAIDDFGTGHSNLSRLPRLHFDTLKIDRSFVTGIAGNADQQTIVRAVVSLSRSLGLTVIAEGVENEADFLFLRDLKVNAAQGFLWCPALPFSDFAELVQALTTEAAGFRAGDLLRA